MKSHLFTRKSTFRMFSILLVMISMLGQVSPARAVTTITVTSANDDGGSGTLRVAIATVNAGAGGDTINFSPGLSGATITLGSELILTKNMTIDGSLITAPVTITGSFGRVFTVNAGVTVTLNRLTIANSQITGVGGGISNAGTLTVTNSTLSGNKAVGLPPSGDGGGIYNSATGVLVVKDSTLSGNIASGSGGGIYNSNTAVNAVTVTNSTFSGNTANGSGGGGGISNVGSLTVMNSTFSGNITSSWGAGINNGAAGTLNFSNTIIANSNSANLDCYNSGTLGVNSNNIVRTSNLCGTPAFTSDPLLGPLANNSGFTQTMALPSDSPAINTGLLSICNTALPGPASKDQRGVTRPQGVACDIGAYEAVLFTLVVNKTGSTGFGTVTSSPAGIDCGATCSKDFFADTMVTLTATPVAGSILSSWAVSGTPLATCPGTGTCTVKMDVARTVTALFVPGFPLTVVKTGAGSGTVTSSPAGISCGATCVFPFALPTLPTPATIVTLTAAPDTGSTFSGWSGEGCSGTGTCVVTMSAARNVTANFSGIPSYTMTVVKTGTGTGTVTSTPAGIACGVTCASVFTSGTVVTLNAVADIGSSFGGWSGAGCSGTGTCVVTMSAVQAVAATFNTSSGPLTLTVIKTGSGTGTVTSSPVGIACGATCSFAFNSGTAVTLTAVPDAGFPFTGWSGGGCSGTGTCVVTMSATQSVIATFGTATTNILTVVKTGTGTGKVTSVPAGIDCGSVCSFPFTIGATVTLTAVPDAGFPFGGWSGGGCSGTGTCVVTMSAAQSVIATFGATAANTLTVVKTGTGTGTVTSAPVGIACGATCSFGFTSGAVVILTAVPDAGITFTGWSGAGCSGTGTCVVTMGASKLVIATFGTPNTNTLSISKIGTGTGKVTSAPVGIDCGSICSYPFAIGAMVTLTAVPDAGIPFVGWSGACSGTGTCVVTMSAAQSVIATFGNAMTFTDVATNYWAYQYVERLYDAGITAGCNTSPSQYCPLASVTRAQMAIFILRGMYGKSFAPPAATGIVFTDVFLSTFAAAWIEQFAKEGITSGCSTSPAKYCPDDNVTRAQMAIFLLKGKYGISYAPPVATGMFTDVPVGSFAANWIEQLAKEGITAGCGGGLYCPNSNVTRDQMALFLVKTFNLP